MPTPRLPLGLVLLVLPFSARADAPSQTLRVTNELRAERVVADRAQKAGWRLLLDARHKGSLRQGPDQVWLSADGRIRILEVKAGRSPLGHGYGFQQGSPGWAVRSVQKVATSSAATPKGRSIAKAVLRWVAEGKPASVEVYRHLESGGRSFVKRAAHHSLTGEAQALARTIIRSGFPAPVTRIRFLPGVLPDSSSPRAVARATAVRPAQTLARSRRAVAPQRVHAIRRVKRAPSVRPVVKLTRTTAPTKVARVVLADGAVPSAPPAPQAASTLKVARAAVARPAAQASAASRVPASSGVASAIRFAAPLGRLAKPLLGGAAVALVATEAARRCADPSISTARCAAFIGRQGIAWGGAAGAALAGAELCAPLGLWAAVCSGGAAVAVGLGLDLGLEAAGLD